MTLSQLHPFVRYVRRLSGGGFAPCLPYDARLFLFTGNGAVEVDGVAYTVTPGSLLYINAGVPYHLQEGASLAVNFDLTHRHSHRTVPIPPLNRAQQVPFAPLEQVTFTDAPQLDRCLYLPTCPGAEETLTALLTEYEQSLPGRDPRMTALLTGLLVQMLRGQQRETTGFSPQMVLDHIHRHYREELTGESLARQFHFHKNYISAAVRRYTGRPLHRYLLEVRIQHAIPLLEEGALSVAEVARAVGFADANYFSRYFKKSTGVSPLSYRNKGDTL